MNNVAVDNDAVPKNGKPRQLILESIAEAMRSFKASKKRLHVISYGNRWGILREGAKRASKICVDKPSAVYFARRLAQKERGASIIIHKRDGSPEEYINL